MKDKTLLILAAGMGSRFGGLKQLEPIGPNGEVIIDYSIYDAIRNGFNKIVFIIREVNYQDFLDTVGKRIEKYCKKHKVKIEYVFQDYSNVPSKFKIPEERVKPLGTAHAILCAKDVINEPFIIINADDFYGNDAFKQASEFIDKNNDENTIGLVGYNVVNTLTENGSVKRGICNIKDGLLESVDESEITVVDEKIQAVSLGSGKLSIIEPQKKVSMNMLAFNPNFFDYIEENFEEFLANSDLLKAEYLMPDVLSKGIKSGKYKVKMIDTDAKWVGVTYKEDKEMVVFYINSLIEDKEYNKDLWKI